MRRAVLLALTALIAIVAGIAWTARHKAPLDQTQGRDAATYLPLGNIAFDRFEGEGEFTEDWIAKPLQAAGEPILSREGDRHGQAYVLRVSFLPSFDGATIIRISSRDGRSGEAFISTLDHRADMPPALAEQTRIALPPASLARIQALAEKAQLASAPFDNDRPVCDGMTVFFEIADAHGYHVIARNSAGFSAGQLALMHTLLNLHVSPKAKAIEYLEGEKPVEGDARR